MMKEMKKPTSPPMKPPCPISLKDCEHNGSQRVRSEQPFDEIEMESEEIMRKVFQTIDCIYPSSLMKKMRRLFIYIVNFGADFIKICSNGIVSYKGKTLDTKSNIIELLEAAVSETFLDQRPTGYDSFMVALQQINAPKTFVSFKKPKTDQMNRSVVGKWKKSKTLSRWKPY